MKQWQLFSRPSRTLRSIVLLVFLSFALVAVLISVQHIVGLSPAYTAGTISVTTTQDQFNTDPGKCSLREAVQSINTNTSFGGCNNPGGADTVQLQALEYTLTITGSGYYDNSLGSIVALKSMTIQGMGMTQTVIQAASDLEDWVVEVHTDSGVVAFGMADLTVQDGPEGGINTWIENTLSRGSSLQFRNMIVQDNNGTGFQLTSGVQPVYVAFDTVLVQNNEGYAGGGISAGGGSVTMEDVTIYNNRAEYGGGMEFGGNYNLDALQMTNVTIYGNSAEDGGGGLYVSNGRTLTATNVTIAGNWAGNSGGNIYNANSTVKLVNTIVSGGRTGVNTANNCAGNPTTNIKSLGYNIDSGNSCGLTGTGDQVNTDPDLAPGLADNGGSIPTLALLEGSPAINAGRNSVCPAKDARGLIRPQAGVCDVGAYEFETPWSFLPILMRPKE